MQRLLSPKEAAHLLGVHPKTLQNWRGIGKSPPYIKLGGKLRSRVQYRAEDIHEWIKLQGWRKKEKQVQHDLDYWRSCSTARLIEEGKSSPSIELCIALAERLEDEDFTGESV